MTSLLLALSLAAPVPKDKTEKADVARLKAIEFLRDKQEKNGGWEGTALNDIAGLKGGTTALATLALLEAGVRPNDPAIEKAVEYLVKERPSKTYVVGLTTQVLARVDAKKYANEIQANADWLLKNAITKGGKLQGWSYPANAIADNSNTHFAVMGLHAAAQAGAKVDAEIWQKLRDHYADTQLRDGGWTYVAIGNPHSTRSMTTAALLGLAVAVKYDKNAKGPDPAFEKGMAALLGDNTFSDGKSTGYDLFTTAELGRVLGSNEFKAGKQVKEWYREGVEKLAKGQQEDGSFKFGEKEIDRGMPVVATAFGLYFIGPKK